MINRSFTLFLIWRRAFLNSWESSGLNTANWWSWWSHSEWDYSCGRRNWNWRLSKRHACNWLCYFHSICGWGYIYFLFSNSIRTSNVRRTVILQRAGNCYRKWCHRSYSGCSINCGWTSRKWDRFGIRFLWSYQRLRWSNFRSLLL